MRLPGWLSDYGRDDLVADAVAGLVVAVVVVPQSLAYAILAGLPPETGLYASVLPLVGYALVGSSRTMAVGPVAVLALLTANAVGRVAEPGSAEAVAAAGVLAGCVAVVLLTMGLLRLGWLASLLSYPVVQGFISAAAVVIAISQLDALLGITLVTVRPLATLAALPGQLTAIHWPTLCLGLSCLAALVFARRWLPGLLSRAAVGETPAAIVSRAAPALVLAVATVLTYGLDLADRGVGVVGDVPAGLPALTLPALSTELLRELAPAAVLISLVAFVESVAIAQALAARQRRRINPDRELLGLGAANAAAAVSAGFPVAGSFSRSSVNDDAGARSPLAGIFTAAGIALIAWGATPLLYYLPQAALAAAIIVAVLSLIDVGSLRAIWRYSRSDGLAMLVTVGGVLGAGVEIGLLAGVAFALGAFVWRTGRPHVAVVGRVPGTEHFRNRDRHAVMTLPEVVGIRIDESLYFANIGYLTDCVWRQVAADERIRDVVLMCPAVNQIDASAVAGLQELNHRLAAARVRLHFSEVKGPVMDTLQRSPLLNELTGHVFLSHHQAIQTLAAPSANATDNHQPENL